MTALGARDWHKEDVAQVLETVRTDSALGLTTAEAAERLGIVGPNELTEHGGRTVWQILWEQVSSVLILILIAAAGLAAFLGKPIDAIAISAIVVLFTVLGLVQEYRAQKAIAALKRMAAPSVKVLRSGAWIEVSAREVVPGDVIKIETGGVVPADCRIIESVNLRVQEAALTGESEPVEKVTEPLAGADLTLGDRRNMAYRGTFATFGRALAVVVSTGMATELGKIAALIQAVRHEPTPLQKRLDALGKILVVIAVLIAALIIGAGVLRGEDIALMLLMGVSLAVAIVPEGLPAVLTFTLAVGAKRMLRRKALIRKLPAVETLGSATVICSDKTGTLTQNKMTVTRIETASSAFEIPVVSSPGSFGLNLPTGDPAVGVALAGACLCNAAELDRNDPSASVGDPTETALVVIAARYGLDKPRLDASLSRVAELPFDSERKRMTTFHRVDSASLPAVLYPVAGRHNQAPYLGITKGAADRLLPLCSHIWTSDGIKPFAECWHDYVHAANHRMASNGLRVLAVAVRLHDALPAVETLPHIETDLVFVGLLGMIDPPRPEARAAVATCKTAGIRPIMITGDHPVTARYIAAELGITEHNGKVVTGQDLERMGAEELGGTVADTNVFARVSPEHKLRIVEVLQAQGHVVAMTGDGVNDAPALKKADIGVAMGTGTDVAKEAADMVLIDDNFATIVAAVEEGRVVYDNVRRFVMFSIAGNIGKVLTVALPPLFGLPLLHADPDLVLESAH
jgi:Ca2+-transporting ATPase